MEISNYTVRVLTPSEGHALTQADKSISDSDRQICYDRLFLAANDSPDNWTEITHAEAEAIEARRNPKAPTPMPPEVDE